MFGSNLKGRKKRIIELAHRLKEKGEGTEEDLERILAEFTFDYGVKEETTWSYYELLTTIGLIIVEYGRNTWKYNIEKEKELKL